MQLLVEYQYITDSNEDSEYMSTYYLHARQRNGGQEAEEFSNVANDSHFCTSFLYIV